MTIIEDTRQQAGKHTLKQQYFESNGIKVIRSKLPCGDYTKMTDLSVIVDTKKDIQEVIGNVTVQHKRFINECYFAQDNNIRLIYLIEDEHIKCISDLNCWYNPRLRHSPRATTGVQLAKILNTIEQRHGVQFMFCKKADTGRVIMEVLCG